MPENNTYTGHIDPSAPDWSGSPWSELLKERYRLVSPFCRYKDVLDTCCGTGWGTVNFIARTARSTVGFDIVPPSENCSSSPHPCRLETMDALDMNVKEGSFDVVLALDSLEHFDRKDGAVYLGNLKRACKDTGIVIGTTPLVPEPALIPIFLGWNKYHLCMYTKESLNSVLRDVFPYLMIYEIYNKICPYFVFICSNRQNSLEGVPGIISSFIRDKKNEESGAKAASYLLWSKRLLKAKDPLRAVYYMVRYIAERMLGLLS